MRNLPDGSAQSGTVRGQNYNAPEINDGQRAIERHVI
jgi:hypothetical protein